jgi:osmotically-inducible protein OsmY
MAEYDLRLRENIEDELQNEPGITTNDVRVTVHDGVATLTGNAGTYREKMLAEEAALRVAGLRAVTNEIAVEIPAARWRDDRDLTEAVVQALRWNAAVPDGVVATVKDGAVTLLGNVTWQSERLAVERAVEGLIGVRSVTNLIAVEAQPGAQDIQSRIERALQRSAIVNASQIGVHLQGSRVVLRGNARSWAERSEAERIAWANGGVSEVDNQIAIGMVGEPEMSTGVPSSSVTVRSASRTR